MDPRLQKAYEDFLAAKQDEHDKRSSYDQAVKARQSAEQALVNAFEAVVDGTPPTTAAATRTGRRRG